jgi:DNA-binding MarR family transcriptional regulator
MTDEARIAAASPGRDRSDPVTRVRVQRPGIAFLLSQLGGQSSKRWSERLAGLGTEPREVMLFRFVALAEGKSQREVAQAIGLPASRIVALVDRLEARGWVERRRSADDRRSHALHVTPRGRALLQQLAALSAEHEAELAAGLDPAERTALVSLLERVAATQGLVMGVHPGFADPRADPMHGGHREEAASSGATPEPPSAGAIPEPPPAGTTTRIDDDG